ncbi:hypothetical protein C8F04DRAFT_1264061 [Mycena alexandri]|uniref:Uncharacterized protein n=1 Tax=Mycena alexandri TaxID=1745969 RepID=A0AAD6SM73_9AGAR|nr:hypothetical protein C8F04DRAFT_1264061 [Mycena alexandri]
MARTNKATRVATTKPTRQRSRKKPGIKPGKVSWVHGTKEVFFASRADEWKGAEEKGLVFLGRFYTKVTNLYVQKYGIDMDDNDDLTEDVADPTDPDAVIPGTQELSQEEAQAWSEKHAKIRKRIAAWYGRKYRAVEERDKELFAGVLGGIPTNGPAYPRKSQPLHFYSRQYYDDRVKARFDKAWATELARAEALEQEPTAEIKIRNAITREVFQEDSQEFHGELKQAVEKEHTAATPIRTAEEIHAALKNAAFYLEPLADGISSKFQMNCSILICGPIGDRGGAIEVRSVHAGTTRGLTAEKWHQYDRMGYDATEKSFIRFTERCFTDAECQERVVAAESTTPGAAGAAAPADGVPASPGDLGANGSAAHGGDAHGGSGGVHGGVHGSGGGVHGGGDAHGDGDAHGRKAASGGRGDTRGGEGEGGGDSGNARGDESHGSDGAPSDRSGADKNRAQDGAGGDGGSSGGDGGSGGDEDGAGGDGGSGGNKHGGDHAVWRPDEEEFLRDWSPEARKAFSSFATRKRDFGVDWAECVDLWLKIEQASGFNNEGGKLTTDSRPKEVTEFINKGRHWIMARKISEPGSKDVEGSYAAVWWGWWAAIKAKGGLALMHGRTGFMLVLAILREVLESGEIVKQKKKDVGAGAAKTAPKGKRKRGDKEKNSEDEGEGTMGSGSGKRRKRQAEAENEGSRQTRQSASNVRPRPRPLRAGQLRQPRA